ncbi:hypothetical protein ACFL6U_20265 [Planctomycetota bacterium]
MKPSDSIKKSIRTDLRFRASSAVREELWADIAAAQAQTTSSPPVLDRPALWRIIMKSRITHVAAALLLLVGIVALSWPGKSEPYTMISLLSVSNAAEQSLFYQTDGIRFMTNRIVLYPRTSPTSQELLDKLSADVTQENNMAFIQAYLQHAALPLTMLGADGQPEMFNLQVSRDAQESMTLIDESWYDMASGRFVRIVRQGDQVLFANAYDGQAVYLARRSAAGNLEVDRQAISASFQAPSNPADFLGMAAGIAHSVPQKHYPPVHDVYDETLADGSAMRVYQLGFKNPWDSFDTYYLFKQSVADNTLMEIRCVVGNEVLSEHQRVATELVEAPGVAWDLERLTTAEDAQASDVQSQSIGFTFLAPEDLTDVDDFKAALFATSPAWTQKRTLVQVPDPIGAGKLLVGFYEAEDGRHVIMTMAKSFNQYMGTLVQRIEQGGQPFPWDHTSVAGFKIHRQREKAASLWWTEIAIKNSGFDPAPNRQGFFGRTPDGFYFTIAVNGPVSDQEMRSLADSLIDARDYRDVDN